MTNGQCVHVEPRHPLETAACVSAEYLPGNFFTLNWDMTQSWSGHGRDTMKKKKKKKARICMITTVNRGLNSTRSLLFSQTCMITTIDLPVTSFSLSLWSWASLLASLRLAAGNPSIALSHVFSYGNPSFSSFILSLKKFQKQNQCNSFCFYSRSRTSEVVVSSD